MAAVATNYAVYVSSDYGATWSAKPNSGVRAWTCIDISADGSVIVAGVSSGYVYTSADYGGTWDERTGVGSANWGGVCISANGNTLIASRVGSRYLVWKSTDGGATWASIYDTGGSNLTVNALCMSADAMRIVAARNGLNPIVSNDGGATWTTSTGNSAGGWTSMSCSATGQYVVLGATLNSNNNSLRWSADYGYSFADVSTYSAYQGCISSDGSKIGLFRSNSSSVIRVSDDMLANYTLQYLAGDRLWTGIACSDDFTKIIACVSSGHLYAGNANTGELSITSVSPNIGPTTGGTPITINGTGFISTSLVYIDGTAAPNTIVHSSTEITCSTPAKTTGAKNVLVTNP